MDDTQRRLGIIETTLAEIKAFLTNAPTNVATKTELEQLRSEVREIKAVLPYLATKADIEDCKAEIETLKLGDEAQAPGVGASNRARSTARCSAH